ncbi:TSC22 domain family protein 3-like [Hoplias malabaricus]|uniref:TSC22 domain family protein 3-like n=1 Tax=Hoplias malabaricus TaxID=27720 RepID=UPI003462AD9F
MRCALTCETPLNTSTNTSTSTSTSVYGPSAVAIDNKIEQAMDLVKGHLLFAVREEVEVLKERIKELWERHYELQRENILLKLLAKSNLQHQKNKAPLSPHRVQSTPLSPYNALQNPEQAQWAQLMQWVQAAEWVKWVQLAQNSQARVDTVGSG